MKYINISIVLLFVTIILLSCQMKNLNEYTKYQTFDEYSLEGVDSSNMKSPYVYVKKDVDTIFVIKSNKKDEVLKYINKGNYWYSLSKVQCKLTFIEKIFDKGLKMSKIPRIYEKFIFNDTIMEYSYLLKDSLERIGQTIYVETKENCLELVIQDDDIKNYNDPYRELMNFVNNYKRIFPVYSPGYQPRFYSLFKKQIKGDSLSIYEIEEPKRRLISKTKLNSLGEFDLPPGIK